MADKIKKVGARAERIRNTGAKAPRGIDRGSCGPRRQAVWRAALAGTDPISVAALGAELLKRLRSSGGRPALADA